eukprot:gene41653-51606_t
MHQHHGHGQAQQHARDGTDACPGRAFACHHGQDLAAGEAQVGEQAEFFAAGQHLGAEAGGHAEEADADGYGLQPVGDGEAAVKDLQLAAPLGWSLLVPFCRAPSAAADEVWGDVSALSLEGAPGREADGWARRRMFACSTAKSTPSAGHRARSLMRAAPLHVAHNGTFVTTPIVKADAATVDVQVTLENNGGATAAQVSTAIYALDAAGRRSGAALAQSSPSALTKVGAGRQILLAQSLQVSQPKFWSPKSPQRYVAVTTVSGEGKVVDEVETPFGIRTVAFDAGRGFLLNGERVVIQGVCMHHDLGALGAALNVRALERQLEILREMGANAIRTTHNPPAPELLDLADRMGFLIVEEAFDAWRLPKKKNDYGRLYDE